MQEQGRKKESTVKDFLEVIFRRKWIILGIVAVATIMVALLNMREPATYESSAKMLVKRGEAQGVFSRSVRTLSWEEEISSQIEMIRSMVVIERAHELLPEFYPEGYTRRGRINYGAINAGVVSTSNVLWVTYSSGDPVFCEAAVNAITKAYKEYYQKVRTPPEMEDFFIRELRAAREEIEYWRDRKERVEEEWGIVDIKAQRNSTLNRLDSYKGNLNKVHQDVRVTEALIDKLTKFRDLDIVEQSAVLSGLMPDSRINVVTTLRNRLVGLKIEEAKLAQDYTDENKNILRVRDQIEGVYAMLEREFNSIILVQETELETLRLKQRLLEGFVRPLETEKEGYPKKEVELERINAALLRLEENYVDLQSEHMNSKISIASNPEWTVTILNPATPGYRKKTRDYVRIALGPLFSLVVALGFAFFIDNLDHSIKNIPEAEESLGLQVLASFPDAIKK